MNQNFDSGGRSVHIALDLLEEQWNALRAEFAANQWSEADGLRYVLAAGLRAIQDERAPQESERIQNERMQLEGRYAVMKYRAFQFMQAVQALEWKLNAARMEVDGLRQLNRQLRQQAQERQDPPPP